MSAATFRETLMLHALLFGNGVAEIERNNRKQPVALWPLVPSRTSLEVAGGTPWYVTRIGEEPGARPARLRPENVIHIRNFGPDGLWGYSTITLARNSWGLGLAGEKYANRYFKNNGMPSGVIEHPAVMSKEAYDRLRRDWREMHEGLDNAGRVAILEQASKYTPVAFSQRDSQWLESRQFQREDVASWFNLPPHKLGVLKDANYSNMAEGNRVYLTTGLRRWEVKWQDEYNEKLLTDREKEEDSHFFEFNNDALLQADIETRFNAYSTALGGHPFMTPDEVRGRDNMNTIEGGDQLPQPLNMSTGREGADDEPADKVEAKIAELLQCEANRVCHAAKTAANFVGWLDAFYGRWVETVAGAVGAAWGENDPMHPESIALTAMQWADAHKRECLEAAGEAADGATLGAVLSAVTAGWSGCAAEYYRQVTI
jgi:HK97 family phage portal protein